MQYGDYKVTKLIHHEPALQIFRCSGADGGEYSLFCFDYSFPCSSPGLHVYTSFSACQRFCVVTDPVDMTLHQFYQKYSQQKDYQRLCAQVIFDLLHDLMRDPLFTGFSPQNVLLVYDPKAQKYMARLGIKMESDPAFKAPEAIASPEASVWGLGVTAFYLLTGKNPYLTRQMGVIEEKIKFYQLADLNRDINPVLRRVVGGMLEYEPGRRLTVQKILDWPEFLRLVVGE